MRTREHERLARRLDMVVADTLEAEALHELFRAADAWKAGEGTYDAVHRAQWMVHYRGEQLQRAILALAEIERNTEAS